MIKSYERLKKQNKDKFSVPRTAQDIIDIDTIYKDGIFCSGKKFSKSYKFKDINYAIASKEEKEGSFLNYSELLNSLDSSVITKITINNHKIDLKSFKEKILIPMKDDGMNDMREEYNNILLDNLANIDGMTQEKYITITAFKDSIDEARNFFARTTVELSAHFAKLGSELEELDATERLKILHDFYRNGEEEQFMFDMEDSMRKGHHFKDAICPYYPVFKDKYFKLGDKYGRVLYLSEYARYIKDSFIAELCSLNKNLMYSLDIITVPTDEAVGEVEKVSLGVDTNIANWQMRQNSNNNFSAAIPYDMEMQRKECKEFLDDLTVRDQRMMFGCITIVHLADSLEELDNDTEVLMSTARKYMCKLSILYGASRQLDGLSTVLPIGTNKLGIVRTLLTESLAVFIPFRAQEIMEEGGYWYGQNAITNNLIMLNKESLLNPNGMNLGVPGSGKSMITKLQVYAIGLRGEDDIIICDPEGEYTPLVQRLGGEVIQIAAGSRNHINAMDMSEGYGDSGNPVGDKSQFIMSLFEQLDREGIKPIDRSIIDRCVTQVYQESYENNEIPTLMTLRRKLLEQPEMEARSLALKLELFTEGSLDVFAHKTNVNTNSRIISYDIFKLGKQLKTIGLLVITDAMINRVNENWKRGKRTHIIIDEFHVVFSNEESASFFNSAWRQFRKRDGYPVGVTQNVEYLLDSVEASTMLSNSECVVMLNQAYQDREKLATLLNISDEQLSYITNAQPGCGLIKYGGSIVPFVCRIPKNTDLYKTITTKPADRK
ncbi:MAG: TraE family protein [Erysipelotrichaceae bacterium]|nr:TraE family protein [Erysipelotrichaceae bacterium]